MKQAAFEKRFASGWDELEDLLLILEREGRDPDLAQLPERYRDLCQQLALARHRVYSAALVERLNSLAVRCHVHLYGRRPAPWGRIATMLLLDFPRALRAEWRLLAVSTVLFALPLLFTMLLCASEPENVYLTLDPMTVADVEAMYDPKSPFHEDERAASGDLVMFGFYIRNNIGIALRTFGMGALAGVGSGIVLIYNGAFIGAVAGYLTAVGYGSTFWPFVVGHGAFELTAIVIAGVAGLKIGLTLLRPGQRTRAQALQEEAREALVLVAGFSAMLFVAAIIEAFWSSARWVPVPVKFGVGGFLWSLVVAWLSLAGRDRGS
ncbi:MAG: stage II sporulation protein M [Alphaproteobacteria bacterium]|nr:stage II sporulation protein M [Alphaproteobacteria bacterium]